MSDKLILSPTEQRVRELVDEFKQTFRRTLTAAIELGEALEAHKASLPHGEWLPWIENHFELRRSMAENLMLLSRNSQRVGNLPPETPIRAAVKWLQDCEREPTGPRPLTEPGSVKSEPLELLRFCQDLPSATIITLILRVAFPDARTALDTTYGSGQFWDGTALIAVTAHDQDPSRALDGVVDFTTLPYDDEHFDVVTFDPPHIADGGTESIMANRFGTAAEADLMELIRGGVREAYRVARLGVIVKVTDHIHGQRFVSESDWVRQALQWQVPYEVVHQVRSGALVDPKWEEQLSARNNGSTYLIFRKDGPIHKRRVTTRE